MIFAVKSRDSLILPEMKDKVENFICGIASNINCKPIAIYCNPDHLHLLSSIKPVTCIADAVRDIKSFSSRYINENHMIEGHFEWQTGYGAFTYGQSQVEAVKAYIANQPNHHKEQSFKDEYRAFLTAFCVDYDEKYVFQGSEDSV
jgi:REP element-mobilizing transposase RayT